jgi:diguanylate cyclase (GGDEF)-like protein
MTSKKLPSKVIDSKDRVIKKLSTENTKLREKVAYILQRVTENETIWAHFTEIENAVISSQRLEDMVLNLAMEFRTRFNLEVVTLILTADLHGNPEQAFHPRRLSQEVEHLYAVSNDSLQRWFNHPYHPILLAALMDDIKAFFFPDATMVVRSGVLLPLELWGGVLGSLNLGSEDNERYDLRNDTSFLERLSSKLALSINNLWSREQLLKLSTTDLLTGLYNRAHLEKVARAELERSVRYGSRCSLIMADLDGFKSINDSRGHEIGDRALKTFASLLKQHTRAADTCARYGGDEFCVILPETPLMGGWSTACKLRTALARTPVDTPEGQLILKASFGVAQNEPGSLMSWEAFLNEADRRLYDAKKQGGGIVMPCCADNIE